MKDLTTTTVQTVIDGVPVIDKIILHTSTSCHLTDKVLVTIGTESPERVTKLILAMYASIQRAEQFISGFEDDETQTGVDDILDMLRQFELS